MVNAERNRYPHVRPVITITGTRYAAYFQYQGIKYEQPGFDNPEEASAFAAKWKAEVKERFQQQQSQKQPRTQKKAVSSKSKRKTKKKTKSTARKNGWRELWKDSVIYVNVQNNQVVAAQIRNDDEITNILICFLYKDGRYFKVLPGISPSRIKENLRSGRFVITDMQKSKIEIEIPEKQSKNK